MNRRDFFKFTRDASLTAAALTLGLQSKASSNEQGELLKAEQLEQVTSKLVTEDAEGRRYLILGGGGVTGLRSQIEMLIDAFGPDAKGQDVLKDMGYPEVWCTSAGGITGIGMATNFTLREIEQMSEHPAFLNGIFFPRDKNAKVEKACVGEQFVVPENYSNLSAEGHSKGILKEFIVAAYEKARGSPYSTAGKVDFMSKVISHTLEPTHQAAIDIPCLQDGKMAGFGDMNVEEIYKRTGCHFNFVLQQDNPREGVIVTSRKDLPKVMYFGDEKVHVVPGDKATIKDAVCGSANPRPFFDGAVLIDGKKCYDGGRTGQNLPTGYALHIAAWDGVNMAKVDMLAMTMGPVKRDYLGKLTRKNPMVLGSHLFDEELANYFDERRKELAKFLPHPERQVTLVVPTITDPTEEAAYLSSMGIKPSECEERNKFIAKLKSGKIPMVQVLGHDGKLTSSQTYSDARNAVVDWGLRGETAYAQRGTKQNSQLKISQPQAARQSRGMTRTI